MGIEQADNSMMIHAMTFDVEEYFHVHAFSGVIDPAHWDQYPSRVEVGTRLVLDMLSQAGIRGTFFTLGWVAQRHPTLMHSIVSAGHELASHGFNHQRVDALTPDEFRQDIRTAKETLENVAGVAVTAYRAPSFSITSKSPWAHQILVEEGYTVDSSVKRNSAPYTITTSAGPLCEFPLPTISVLGRGVGVGGGGYFRLFPEWLSRRAVRAAESAGRPFCVYLHPWEFDPDQPRIAAPALSTFRHRVGLTQTAKRLQRLLASFRFGSLAQSLQSDHRASAPLIAPVGHSASAAAMPDSK